ncbi:MAG: hypothetical protein WD342_02930 [Verrucomicrobiales bacterium]
MKLNAIIAFLCLQYSCLCLGGPHDWINNDDGPDFEFAGPPEYLLKAFGVASYPKILKDHPEEYRIFYSPPFSSPILVIITVKQDKTCTLTLLRLSGPGGYPDDLGKIDYADTTKLNVEEKRGLLSKLRKDEVYDAMNGLTEMQVMFLESMDGNSTIIERVVEGKHSACRVSSPRYLAQELEGLIENQGLTVYSKIDLEPFVDAFDAVCKSAGLEFNSAYGEVTIKKEH